MSGAHCGGTPPAPPACPVPWLSVVAAAPSLLGTTAGATSAGSRIPATSEAQSAVGLMLLFASFDLINHCITANVHGMPKGVIQYVLNCQPPLRRADTHEGQILTAYIASALPGPIDPGGCRRGLCERTGLVTTKSKLDKWTAGACGRVVVGVGARRGGTRTGVMSSPCDTLRRKAPTRSLSFVFSASTALTCA